MRYACSQHDWNHPDSLCSTFAKCALLFKQHLVNTVSEHVQIQIRHLVAARRTSHTSVRAHSFSVPHTRGRIPPLSIAIALKGACYSSLYEATEYSGAYCKFVLFRWEWKQVRTLQAAWSFLTYLKLLYNVSTSNVVHTDGTRNFSFPLSATNCLLLALSTFFPIAHSHLNNSTNNHGLQNLNGTLPFRCHVLCHPCSPFQPHCQESTSREPPSHVHWPIQQPTSSGM